MKKVPVFRLVPDPLTDEAKNLPGFKWAGKEIGKRHRLGGEPNFLQQPDWPSCPHCRMPMSFYGQLDSINDEYIIADCGMIYVFVCFDCNETKALIQSH